MIGLDGINFKDSLSSTTNMDSTDDNYDGDAISTIYFKKNLPIILNMILLTIVPKNFINIIN